MEVCQKFPQGLKKAGAMMAPAFKMSPSLWGIRKVAMGVKFWVEVLG